MDKAKALLLKELREFQQIATGAKKDANNPFFKTKYADLESVTAAIKEGTKKLNLGYYHTIDNAVLTTVLFYSDGKEYAEITSSLSVDVKINGKNAMQDMGSAITYAKRYTLQSLFGLPSEDDDGNSLQGAQIQQPPKTKPYTMATLNNSKKYFEDNYFKGKMDNDPVMIGNVIREFIVSKGYTIDSKVSNEISQFCIEMATKHNDSIDV